MYKRIVRNLIFCSADTDSNFIGKGKIVNGSKLPDVIMLYNPWEIRFSFYTSNIYLFNNLQNNETQASSIIVFPSDAVLWCLWPHSEVFYKTFSPVLCTLVNYIHNVKFEAINLFSPKVLCILNILSRLAQYAMEITHNKFWYYNMITSQWSFM